MLHDFFHWLQNTWGASADGSVPSYSQALLGSPNFWGLLEGTHLLTLMLFFGTILMVDMRLLGVSFKQTPVSVISKRVLPLTVFSMIIVIVTGVVLFFSKPEEYWHNVWFRWKMVLLALAMINVGVMYAFVEKDIETWDRSPSPPRKAKLAGIISITSWVLVIMCGRLIAYNWFECGKPQPDWVNTVADCKISSKGMMSLDDAVLTEDSGSYAPPPEAPPEPAPDTTAAPAAQPEAK